MIPFLAFACVVKLLYDLSDLRSELSWLRGISMDQLRFLRELKELKEKELKKD